MATTVRTDDDLVLAARRGDGAAFAALVERHQRRVHGLAYRLLGDATDAEDATQETFVRAYTRLSSYLPGGKFASWLLAITSHWCVDSLRRRRTVSLDAVQASLGWPSGADYPEELAVRAEGRVEVQRWLATLPEPYRLVLVLRYWHDLSYSEISATIGEPVSTVRMRLFRARQSLIKSCRQAPAAAPAALVVA
jgi:RNA polymerase sigma-70 factor, ECF subfamily